MGAVTVSNALISAFTVWAGFMAVPMLINHRYQMLPLRLTLIDSGHWFGVVLIQGLIIGCSASEPSSRGGRRRAGFA
jgi:hypothetical protein